MWFKRKKKTEQDHLLSESLKSLQTLVSESSDRLEPSLEPRHTGTNMDNADNNDAVRESRPEPREATELDEPSVPDSGNRWKDLSLSFDAEPVAPRSRRGSDSTRETEKEDREKEAREDVAATRTDRETKQQQADRDTLETTARQKASGLPATDPERAPVDQNSVDQVPAPQAPTRNGLLVVDEADTEEPEMDLELEDMEHETPASSVSSGDPDEEDDGEPSIQYFDRGEPPTDELLDDADDAPMLEIELPPLEDNVDTNAHPEPAEKPGENREDQLHLELEPGEGDIPNIPTLTEAVYVPDAESEAPTEIELAPAPPDETPAEAPEPVTVTNESPTEAPEPATASDQSPAKAQETAITPDDTTETEGAPTITEETLAVPGRIPSRFDEHVEQCLENLRVRFQLMGLEALSDQQETELRDTLIELLDDFELPSDDQT